MKRQFLNTADMLAIVGDSEQSGDGMMIIDMGTHMLSGQVGSQNLLQVAIPGLEDRARTFPPLHGVLLMPGEPFLGGQNPLLEQIHISAQVSTKLTESTKMLWRVFREGKGACRLFCDR